MTPQGRPVQTCRSCGDRGLVAVLSLGSTPIANALVDPASAPPTDPSYPLEVVFCPTCTLVQLGYELSADAIFGDDYPYFSSFSEMFARHAADHVAGLLTTRDLTSSSLAVEVASNDGYLLRHFVEAGVRAVGIDPAPGPAAAAEVVGVPTIVEFFGVAAAERIVADHGRADVVIANNVMAHVPDLNDFVGGFAALLADDGLLTIENPSVREMVERVEFDTVYHEHYCYFSCSSVDALVRRHRLHLNDVEWFPDLHGGTLRYHVAKRRDQTARCRDQLDKERAIGLIAPPYYEHFAEQVRVCQEELRALLDGLRETGRVVAAYGAAAKGATLLNSTGIDTSLVAYVVDRNPHKQGKLMPGCRLPIRPVEVLADEQPDDVLVLAWNFAAEIVAQQQAYARAGGTFYRPVPHPEVIPAR